MQEERAWAYELDRDMSNFSVTKKKIRSVKKRGSCMAGEAARAKLRSCEVADV